MADLRRLGLNTLGIHTNATMLTHPPGRARFPFVAPYEPLVWSHYLKPQPDAYADIFAREFEAKRERTARRVAAPYRDDPWCWATAWRIARPRRTTRRIGTAARPGPAGYATSPPRRPESRPTSTACASAMATSPVSTPPTPPASARGRFCSPQQTGDPTKPPRIRRSAMTTRRSCSSASIATTPWQGPSSAAPTRTTSSSATRSTATRTGSTPSPAQQASTPTS